MHQITRVIMMTSLCLLSLLLHSCAVAVVGTTATGASIVHDRRTAGSIVEDQSIELKAYNAIHKESYYAISRVVIVSFNGKVLLAGQVPNNEIREEIDLQTQSVPRVLGVYNQITIGSPIGVRRQAKDSVITARVKTNMFSKQKLDATHIKVVTENASVFLMGIVTRSEALQATDAARTVPGVRRVVRLFEYKDKG